MVVLAAILAVAYLGVGAEAQNTPKEQCDLCANIGQGKNGYICPKDVVKDCMINLNGWCCQKTKVHSKCKSCAQMTRDDDHDDDLPDEEDEIDDEI